MMLESSLNFSSKLDSPCMFHFPGTKLHTANYLEDLLQNTQLPGDAGAVLDPRTNRIGYDVYQTCGILKPS
jgi:hypothetical protein